MDWLLFHTHLWLTLFVAKSVYTLFNTHTYTYAHIRCWWADERVMDSYYRHTSNDSLHILLLLLLCSLISLRPIRFTLFRFSLKLFCCFWSLYVKCQHKFLVFSGICRTHNIQIERRGATTSLFMLEADFWFLQHFSYNGMAIVHATSKLLCLIVHIYEMYIILSATCGIHVC